MKILPSPIGRGLTAIMFILLGVTFQQFGYAFIHAGKAVGFGLILVGIGPLLFAPIYLWRGGRLGAEIQQDALVVRSYFRRADVTIPLVRLLMVHRGVGDDTTVLEFPDRQFILDDSYFPDSEARDLMFRSLQFYARSSITDGTKPPVRQASDVGGGR